MRAEQPLPKQFVQWRGKPVVRHSVESLAAYGANPIVVVIPEGAATAAAKAVGPHSSSVKFVVGGATRQESVRRGLESIEEMAPDRVLVHDAARPIVPSDVISRLQLSLDEHPGAIPVLPVVDSLTHAENGVMTAAAHRNSLWRVQTPQAFHYAAILEAHREWDGEPDAGDDAQVAISAGLTVATVEGDERLQKLTFAHDFAQTLPMVRVGMGYDVHRLEEGEELWLCGVRLEHSHGLSGHSDADVAIHALVDALLGAVGRGDIGQHFPPSDRKWKGASSDRFLVHAMEQVVGAGYFLGNADLTIICEAPRIGPHRDAMRERLADIMSVDPALISVKATTTEKLGFTGRSEGIAAQAVVSLCRN